MADIFYSTLIVFYFYAGWALLARYFLIPTYYGFAKAEILWPLLFFIVLVATYLSEKKDIRRVLRRDVLKKNLLFFLVFIGLFIIRFININKVSLWLDEDGQFRSAFRVYPLYGSAGEQQPPLDYQFTAVAVWFLGFSAWAQRLHAALFSALSGALLFEWCRRILKSSWSALVLTIFYAFQFVVVQYGYEARPISLALFLEVLFLHRIYCVLQPEADDFYQSKTWSLTAVSFLYLCSVGMQPPVIVICTLFYLGLVWLFKRQHKQEFLAVARGFLFFLPIQIFITSMSGRYFKKPNGLGILDFLNEVKLDNYWAIQDYFLPIGFLAILLAILFLGRDLIRRRIRDWSSLYFFVTLMIFSSALLPLLRSRVDIFITQRYFVSCLPLIIILFCLQWKNLVELLGKYRNLIGSILITLLGIGAIPYYRFGPLTNLETVYKREDLRGLYAEIKKIQPDTEKSLLLTTGLNELGWYPQIPLTKFFYYKKLDKNKIYELSDSSLSDYERALQKEDLRFEDVFIIHYMSWSQESLSEQNRVTFLQGLELYHIHLEKGQSPARAVADFLEPVAKKAESEGKFYISPIEYLWASYLFLHDESKINEYKNLYLKNRSSQNKSEYIEGQLDPSERL